MNTVVGSKQIIANIIARKAIMVGKLTIAVMDVAGGVARNAQSGHDKGTEPHNRGRYENQTMKLTRSIKSFPVHANLKEIRATVVASAKSDGYYYGTALEMGYFTSAGNYVHYPFMYPALVGNINNMTRKIYQAVAL